MENTSVGRKEEEDDDGGEERLDNSERCLWTDTLGCNVTIYFPGMICVVGVADDLGSEEIDVTAPADMSEIHDPSNNNNKSISPVVYIVVLLEWKYVEIHRTALQNIKKNELILSGAYYQTPHVLWIGRLLCNGYLIKRSLTPLEK